MTERTGEARPWAFATILLVAGVILGVLGVLAVANWTTDPRFDAATWAAGAAWANVAATLVIFTAGLSLLRGQSRLVSRQLNEAQVRENDRLRVQADLVSVWIDLRTIGDWDMRPATDPRWVRWTKAGNTKPPRDQWERIDVAWQNSSLAAIYNAAILLRDEDTGELVEGPECGLQLHTCPPGSGGRASVNTARAGRNVVAELVFTDSHERRWRRLAQHGRLEPMDLEDLGFDEPTWERFRQEPDGGW